MESAVAKRIGPEAWDGLEELREGLRASLVRQCHDENDLDDVIQETFLRAARYRCDRRVRSLRPWTMRIALNVLADTRRRVAHAHGFQEETSEVVAPPPPAPDERRFRVGRFWIDGESAQELLARALTDVRAQDRALLDSYYGRAGGGAAGGTRSAAQACGVPGRVVKVRLFRARRRLQRALRQRVSTESRWSALAS